MGGGRGRGGGKVWLAWFGLAWLSEQGVARALQLEASIKDLSITHRLPGSLSLTPDYSWDLDKSGHLLGIATISCLASRLVRRY